ncbi:MAG: hypothetical protein ACLQAT_31840 [Candidatus Binataceae bacterium]
MKKFFIAILLIGAAFAPGSQAYAGDSTFGSFSSKFVVCSNQTYALCAASSCFVMDGLAYCVCDVESGDSISLADSFGNGQNVCTVNAEGVDNGYMVSTFSLPDSVLAPDGSQALYTCPASTSSGAYAQCDGGVCFTSTQGKSFPGFSQPLSESQIICSCPITVADPATATTGYQIVGPYPCQKSFFKNCSRANANKLTGAQIYVGAPAGVPRVLTRQLYGSVPALNHCLP